MRIRLTSALVAPLLVIGAAHASAQSTWQQKREEARLAVRRAIADAREYYQGRRGPEQSDTLSRKVKLGRDGRVSISNVSGDIVVTAGAGDEMSIEAVKRGRGSRSLLDRVSIVIDEHPGRVDVRTEYGNWLWHDDNVSVDYTIVVPASAAVDLHSVSGRIRVTGVKGTIRLGSVSGTLTSVDTPRVEYARTVSGEIDLGGIAHDSNLSISSVSGSIQVTGLRVRAVDTTTVSGDVRLRDAACERVTAKAISGSFDYAGTLARNGRYEVNSHSGSLRFTLADNTGFELSAASFSGAVRSDFQMTVGGSRNPDIRAGRSRGHGPRSESLQSAFGDGSASLNLRTFSGNIVIAKK